MIAATTLPVIGVPIESSPLNGLDALLATVHMPPGVPVATTTARLPELYFLFTAYRTWKKYAQSGHLAIPPDRTGPGGHGVPLPLAAP